MGLRTSVCTSVNGTIFVYVVNYRQIIFIERGGALAEGWGGEARCVEERVISESGARGSED
jgi:hypothetical protein